MLNTTMNAVQALNAAFAITEQELTNALNDSRAREQQLSEEVRVLQESLAASSALQEETKSTLSTSDDALAISTSQYGLTLAKLAVAEESLVKAQLQVGELYTTQLLLDQTKQYLAEARTSKDEVTRELLQANARADSLHDLAETLKTCLATISVAHTNTVKELKASFRNAHEEQVAQNDRFVQVLREQVQTAEMHAQSWVSSHAKLLDMLHSQTESHCAEVKVLQEAKAQQEIVFSTSLAALNAELERVRRSKTWQLHEFLTGFLQTGKTSNKQLVVAAPKQLADNCVAPLAISQPPMVSYTTMSNSISVNPAATLDQLLSYHDEQFVICAYRTLLGRSPDAHGLKYYVEQRLARGVSKIEVIKQLYSSSEAKTYACAMPGLNKAVTSFKRGNTPVIGWLFRLFEECERKHPIDTKLRMIEHSLYTIKRDNQEFHARFDMLADALARGTHSLPLTIQAAAPAVAGPGVVNENIDTSLLSPQGKEIHKELKAAIRQNS